jgi:hypothetical protein
MAKFNNTPSKNRKMTTSEDGVKAFQKSMYQDLCDRVLTCFYGQDKFYSSGYKANKELSSLIQKVGKEDPMFIAKLAILSREKFNLRSVSHVLTAELSRIVSTLNTKEDIDTSVVKTVAERVVVRVDDITEILSYLIYNYSKEKQSQHGTRHLDKKFSKQLRKGLQNAIAKFDAYQLGKYKAAKKEVKLRDVFRILRPKPMDEDQAKLWGQLMDGTLEQSNTWENKISGAGQIDKKGKTESEIKKEVDDAKSDNWEKLLISKKLPYMALLRNLRNIVEANVSKEAVDAAVSFLTNEKAVLNSKQFPFRFFSAYKALNGQVGYDPYNRLRAKLTMEVDPFASKYGSATSKPSVANTKERFLAALNKALWHSGKNVPKLEGNTVIAVDLSGSMDSRLSDKSEVTYMEVGAVMGSLAQQYCNQSIVYGFGATQQIIKVDERGENPLDRVQEIMNTSVGHSTNLHAVINDMTKRGMHVDQMFVFTDCQLNGSYWGGSSSSLMGDLKTYQTKVNKDIKVYEFNLAASDASTQLDPKNPNYFHLSGWSDGLLKSVVEMETMKHGILDMVNAVEL